MTWSGPWPMLNRCMYLTSLYSFSDRFCLILTEFMAIDTQHEASRSMLLKPQLWVSDLTMTRPVTSKLKWLALIRSISLSRYGYWFSSCRQEAVSPPPPPQQVVVVKYPAAACRVSSRRAGGHFYASPSGFSRISHQRARHPFLVYLFMPLFRISRKKNQTRSPKVRSPGHLKWPHLWKSSNARHGYTECLITLKLSGIDIHTSMYKMYI